MAKNEEQTIKEEISWGTWEELLLACAVKKHGTKNWESVAMEIQNKNSSSSNFVVTPHNCKQKYNDLHRRFMVKDDKIVVDSDNKSDHNRKKDDNRIPWLDELRKLRVAELKREVQQYDVSIVSLQWKVKRLKEEREQSLREKENDTDVKPDLLEEKTEEDKKERETEPIRYSPVHNTRKPVSGDDSDRDNQSCNESNSSDLKDENEEVKVNRNSEPIQTVIYKPDLDSKESPVNKPVGEGSYNGSSETIAKDSVFPVIAKSIERIQAELWESVAESKGGGGSNGGEGTKESSDVQSSASLSRKNQRRKLISGSSSGEERETDEVSPAINLTPINSQPLASFLEMIISHKLGSIFQSRLESQETTKYSNLIRQHIDMETIQTRLKESRYTGSCSLKFFRDLLLLFNNTIIFYPKNSLESVSATELRGLVIKELSSRSSLSPSRNQNHPSSPDESTPPTTTTEPPPPPQPLPSVPTPDLEPSDSLISKPKTSVPIIACRKRSSISKASISSMQFEKKGSDHKVVEEKPVVVVDKKEKDNSSVAAAEQSLLSKRKGEGSASGTRSSRSSSKNRNNPKKNSNQNTGPSLTSRDSSTKGEGDGDDNNNSETKTEKEEKKNNDNTTTTTTTNTVAKKRSVTNFLNRMKRNSTPSKNIGTLLETLKNTSSSNKSNNNTKGESGGGGSKEEKKSGGKKETQVRRQSSSPRQQAAEENSLANKRTVGRPPKRALAAAAPPPSKRMREREKEKEKEVEPEVRQPKKRKRR